MVYRIRIKIKLQTLLRRIRLLPFFHKHKYLQFRKLLRLARMRNSNFS